MEELKELEKLIKRARRKEIERKNIQSQLFQIIDDLNIDLEQSTESENASNLEEAINCYISYGEYDIKSIINEIKKSMNP